MKNSAIYLRLYSTSISNCFAALKTITFPIFFICFFAAKALLADAGMVSPTTYVSLDVPVTIVDNATVSSTLTILDAGTVSDINFNNVVLTHTYISDLTLTLKSPQGTTATMIANLCGSSQNINVSFDDESPDLTLCSDLQSGNSFKPFTNLLNLFDGESITGIWTFEVHDNFAGDAGTIDAWELEVEVTPLPVELASLQLQASDCEVSVNWETSSEINSDYFEIQRSTDGIDFAKVARVDAQGGNFSQAYEYLDRQVSGLHYYRLKMVDTDESKSYSPIVSVETSCAGTEEERLILYPNPIRRTHDKLHIKYFADGGPAELVMADYSGKVIETLSLQTARDWHTDQLDISQFPDGIYFLCTKSALEPRTFKLVISR